MTAANQNAGFVVTWWYCNRWEVWNGYGWVPITTVSPQWYLSRPHQWIHVHLHWRLLWKRLLHRWFVLLYFSYCSSYACFKRCRHHSFIFVLYIWNSLLLKSDSAIPTTPFSTVIKLISSNNHLLPHFRLPRDRRRLRLSFYVHIARLTNWSIIMPPTVEPGAISIALSVRSSVRLSVRPSRT